MGRRGNGSSIYLGRPIASPPGVFIGMPGHTIFGKSHEVDTAEGFVIDFTNYQINFTNYQIIYD